jgi:hypothetical protein
MKTRTICKRCHRLREVLGQYCAACQADLRAIEQPKRAPTGDPPQASGEETVDDDLPVAG